jgi:hypothetical protein
MVNAGKETKKKNERAAHVATTAAAPAEKLSQPGSKAGITSSVRGDTVTDTAFPLGSKAGASIGE